MDSESLREQDFANNSFILVKYATKSFRHKINLPPAFMSVLPELVPAFVSVCTNSTTVQDLVASLDDLVKINSGHAMFVTSVNEIKEYLQSDSKSIYVWEMAADLVQLYGALLDHLSKCLSVVGDTDAQIDAEIGKIPKYQADLANSKPESARPATEVSLDFSDVTNLRHFQAFTQAQAISLLRCAGCQRRAVWFAVPCLHAVCCDQCKENYPDFEEFCPECYEEITELVRLTE